MTRGGYRPGAGRKPSRDPRTVPLQIWLTPMEHAELLAAARGDGDSLAAWVRTRSLASARSE